eukprot:6144096-Prymnesium_polylepis.1
MKANEVGAQQYETILLVVRHLRLQRDEAPGEARGRGRRPMDFALLSANRQPGSPYSERSWHLAPELQNA